MPTDDQPRATILIVEDDDAIRFGLRTNLAFEGFEVHVASTREEAIARAREVVPDLMLLDLMLPDGSGFEVMEALGREQYAGLILVLSARKEETDKVVALRMGADDYVTKPFSLAELLARIEALLRRAPAQLNQRRSLGEDRTAMQQPQPVDARAAARVRFGRCEIDLDARLLRVDQEPVALTRLEFDLLAYLAQNAGRALSRGLLLREVWGLSHDGSARTVDNVIAHLRTKIGEDADHPRHLLTMRGAGYRFEIAPTPPK